MIARLVRFAVGQPVLVVLLALIMLIYGVYQLSHAALDIFPEFSAPRVVIQTEAPGLTAEQTETLVSQKIEKHLAGLIGLDSLRSESIQGLSVVTAVFREHSNIYQNRQWVGERLAMVMGELPTGVGPPVMVPLSSASSTVLTIGLRSDSKSLMELRDLVDWTLMPLLLAVPGVADVNVFGGDVRQLQIQPDFDKLRRHGLSLNDLLTAARQATDMRGTGFIENDNQRLAIRMDGLPADREALKQAVLIRNEGATVTLGDVATVVDGARPPIGRAAIDGKPAIVLMVIGQYGANTLSVSRQTEAVLKKFESHLGRQGIELYSRLFRPADYIERSLENLTGHLLVGGGLVLAVLYIFLFDIRAAAISALAIPLSLLAGVEVLLMFGINLNIMVLGGLAIALGEVVDDAIIDTENIFRRLRENRQMQHPRSVVRVVYRASLEVRASVVYASFIVVLVFLPLLTLGGITGRLFAPLGQAYILGVLMSLLTAMTVTPALCLLFLGRERTSLEPPLVRLIRPAYQALLRIMSGHPLSSLLASLACCMLLLMKLPLLGVEFLPTLREGHFILHTASLPGTSLEESARIGGQLTREIRKISDVLSVSQWTGRAERGADTYGSHYSEYEVRLVPLSGREQADLLMKLRKILAEFPGINSEANTFLIERVDETISGYTSPLAINLYGHDLDRLDTLARHVADMIRHTPGSADVQLRSPPGTPLIDVELDLSKLAGYGIRPLEVADALETAFRGNVVGRYFLDNRAFDVTLILPPEQRGRVETVGKIPVKTPDGLWVELGQLADIRQVAGRYNILHRGGQRMQTVTANVTGRDLGSFVDEVRRRAGLELDLPPDIYLEFTGAAVEQKKASEELIVHSLLAGIGVLILVYMAIGSFRNLLLTLVNLPFSLAGGVIAAALVGGILSVGSLVGFVTLFGITVRNSIMLISHYRQLVEQEGQKWNLETAVRGATERLPSILMTALVTALAMLPIAIDSDNPGREIMGPMAAVIIGGLASSTVLNLLLLPVVLLRFGKFSVRT